MGDNRTVGPAATPFVVALDELTYSSDATTLLPLYRLVHVIGAEGSKTVVEMVTNAAPSTTGYGLQTRVTPVGAPYHAVAAGSGDAGSVKGSAGVVRALSAFNTAAAVRYVKLHNSASAPTPGSGVVATFGIQAGTRCDFVIPGGIAFSTGIGVSMVTGIADNNASGVTAGDVVLDIYYE